MKNILNYVWLLPAVLLFTGCPVGIDYPLGEPGKEQIDKSLIGTWTTDGDDPDYKKAVITRKDDYSYGIEVFETGTMYSLDVTEFTAWVTKVGNKTFVYAQAAESEDSKYYLYCYQPVDKKTMKSFDVSLLVGGMDSITSTQAFQKEVKASMGMEGFLTDEHVWTKE